AVGVLSLGNRILNHIFAGGRIPYPIIAFTLESVWLWAAFTPSILRLAARFPVARPRLMLHLRVQILLAVGFHVLDVTLDRLLLPLVGVVENDSFLALFSGELFINVFSYLATAAVGHALSYAALSQERRLNLTRLGTELARAQLRALEMQLR